MSATAKKRKAHELEDCPSNDDARPSKIAASEPSSSPPAPPHLPASCLAAVLNFLEYSDVRQCMLAGKTMAVDAASQVETLNIMNAAELVGPAARRFANASELNILCLLTGHPRPNGGTLSAATATRAVPFLLMFHKLKRVYLGALWWSRRRSGWTRIPYKFFTCEGPVDHHSVFRSLVENLCGAFQTKMLSSDINIDGVLKENHLECRQAADESINYDASDDLCRCCRKSLLSFPVRLFFVLSPTATSQAPSAQHLRFN